MRKVDIQKDIGQITICPVNPTGISISAGVGDELKEISVSGYVVDSAKADIIADRRYTGIERQMLYAQIRKCAPKTGVAMVKIGKRYLSANCLDKLSPGIQRVLYVDGKFCRMPVAKYANHITIDVESLDVSGTVPVAGRRVMCLSNTDILYPFNTKQLISWMYLD